MDTSVKMKSVSLGGEGKGRTKGQYQACDTKLRHLSDSG